MKHILKIFNLFLFNIFILLLLYIFQLFIILEEKIKFSYILFNYN